MISFDAFFAFACAYIADGCKFYGLLSNKNNFHCRFSFAHAHIPITPVTVRGREFFRGFFLQARDAETNEWIGSWQDSQHTKTIPECASITHADPRDKEGANLIWNAPQHKSGRVYFTYVFVRFDYHLNVYVQCAPVQCKIAATSAAAHV